MLRKIVENCNSMCDVALRMWLTLLQVLTVVFFDFNILLPQIDETGEMSFPPKDPCLVLGAPVPQLVALWSAIFMRALLNFIDFSCFY